VEHIPGQADGSRSHGSTRRVHGGARPRLAPQRPAPLRRRSRRHHNIRDAGEWRIAADPQTLGFRRVSAASGEGVKSRSKPVEVSSVAGPFDCAPWRGPVPPKSAGIGRRRRGRRRRRERGARVRVSVAQEREK
jgi:hypothetical protein